VEDELLAHRALEGEVELLERLAGRKAGGADATLAAVGLGEAASVESRASAKRS
jgi:hypothetical protein